MDKIEALRDGLGLTSTSEVVRQAISKFNFDRFKFDAPSHRQISVRLPSDQRSLLKKTAKAKHASVGELLRVAIEALAQQPMKKVVKPAEKTPSKAAAKAAPKAAKKAEKKAAPKKLEKPAKASKKAAKKAAKKASKKASKR